jgi:hypothetical protein
VTDRLEGKLLDYWSKYIHDAAETLGLRDWEIVLKTDLLDEEEDDNGALPLAQCNFTDGRKHAVVQLSLEFIGRAAQVQRYVIAHELVHCHFGPAWRQVEKDLSAILGRPAETVFWNAFERNMELGIDGVAQLADVLPLPKQPDGGAK